MDICITWHKRSTFQVPTVFFFLCNSLQQYHSWQFWNEVTMYLLKKVCNLKFIFANWKSSLLCLVKTWHVKMEKPYLIIIWQGCSSWVAWMGIYPSTFGQDYTKLHSLPIHFWSNTIRLHPLPTHYSQASDATDLTQNLQGVTDYIAFY